MVYDPHNTKSLFISGVSFVALSMVITGPFVPVSLINSYNCYESLVE